MSRPKNRPIECDTIAHLPAPRELLVQFEAGAPYKVDLVVYMLGVASADPNRPVIVAVTDFTPYVSSCYDKTVAPVFHDITIGSSTLPQACGFTVVTRTRQIKSVLSMFGLKELQVHAGWNDGVFAHVSFTLKTFYNQAEGVALGLMTEITEQNYKRYDGPQFRGLLRRFAKYADADLLAKVKFPVAELVAVSEQPQQKRRARDGVQSDALKLVFRQHSTDADTQRPISYDSQAVATRMPAVVVVDDNTQMQTQPETQWTAIQSRQTTQGSQLNSLSSPGSESDYAMFLVNKVSIDVLRTIPDSESALSKHLQYEIKGHVRVTTPEFIFKPFKRTLKVSEFRFLVAESDASPISNYVEVELMTEKEVCGFFAVSEVEEFYDRIPEIQASLRRLQSGVRSVTVTRSVTTLNGFAVPYWACVGTINDL